MAYPFGAAVSPLVDEAARYAGGIEHVPSIHLPMWLPALRAPAPWTAGIVDGAHVTRLLLRHSPTSVQWAGCEVLNLYRVPTAIPPAMVLDNADRALREGHATWISTSLVDVPPRYGITAAHASGWVPGQDQDVYTQFRYYAITAAAGGALIEQGIVIAANAHAALADEVQSLTNNLHRALLESIDRPHDPRL